MTEKLQEIELITLHKSVLMVICYLVKQNSQFAEC